MDHLVMYHPLNSRGYRCQNSWENHLMIDPKMGADSTIQESRISSGPIFGEQVKTYCIISLRTHSYLIQALTTEKKTSSGMPLPNHG